MVPVPAVGVYGVSPSQCRAQVKQQSLAGPPLISKAFVQIFQCCQSFSKSYSVQVSRQSQEVHVIPSVVALQHQVRLNPQELVVRGYAQSLPSVSNYLRFQWLRAL